MKHISISLLGAALLLILPAAADAQPGGPAQKHPGHSAPAPDAKPVRPAAQHPYGQWDSRWGSRPPAPPRHWTKTGDWYRHVRACRQQYRSYDPRTDTYRTRSGKTRRCLA